MSSCHLTSHAIQVKSITSQVTANHASRLGCQVALQSNPSRLRTGSVPRKLVTVSNKCLKSHEVGVLSYKLNTRSNGLSIQLLVLKLSVNWNPPFIFTMHLALHNKISG